MARSRKSKPAGEAILLTKETMEDSNFTTLESPEPSDKSPVNIELTASEEPVKAPEPQPVEKVQTDVREKLAKRTDGESPFIPTNPVALEKAASEVAKEHGFELNRGTSIGARLLARSQKRV